MNKRPVETNNKRSAIWGIFAILLFVILGLVVVRFLGGESENIAEEEIKDSTVVVQQRKFGERKKIYDRNFRELAVSFRRSSIYARPLELENQESVAHEIAEILAVDEKKVLADLKGERSFVWLGRDIANDQAEQVVNLNLRGVYRIVQAHRFYPWGQIGAHVVGFLKDEQGLAGVESIYDAILRGRGVYDSRLRDVGVSDEIMDGEVGADIVLTLDFDMQALLEKRLQALSGKISAQNAMAAIMVPDSGEIIALASLPSYDPNRFWGCETDARRNRVVEDEVDLGAMKRLFCKAANVSKDNSVTPAHNAESTAAWNWIRNGVYVSSELLGSDGATCGNSLGGIVKELGLQVPGAIDLPGANFSVKEAGFSQAGKFTEVEFEDVAEVGLKALSGKDLMPKATPLSLLTSFSRLLNGGKSITPHVLRSVLSGEQIWDIPARDVERYSVDPDVSRVMLSNLRREVGGNMMPVMLESLQQKRIPGKPAAEGDFQEKIVADTILLGAVPIERPEFALVIILEGARVDVSKKSSVRDMANNILVNARKILKKQKSLPATGELARRDSQFYKQWRKLQAKVEKPMTAQGPQGLKMPDVRGGSLRKALQVLQQYGLRLQITGSGRVINQYPTQGTSLLGVEQCVLELKVTQ